MGIEYKVGPSTAGLAQRIENKKYDLKEEKLYVMKKNYVMTCVIPQF